MQNKCESYRLSQPAVTVLTGFLANLGFDVGSENVDR